MVAPLAIGQKLNPDCALDVVLPSETIEFFCPPSPLSSPLEGEERGEGANAKFGLKLEIRGQVIAEC